MNVPAPTNPFAVSTTRIPCGLGEIIFDHYDDGEVLDATLMRAGKKILRLRPGQRCYLRILLDRIGTVVAYDDLTCGPRASLRRDLGIKRRALENLGLELDSAPAVGYRLRVAKSNVFTVTIGDVKIDVDARIIACGDIVKQVGPNVLGVFLSLADRSHAAADLYRTVWGGEPFEIDGVVQARIGDVRDVLRRIGSRCRVTTLTVHDHRGRRIARYMLQRPDEHPRRFVWPQRPACAQLSLFPVEQIGVFDDGPMPTILKSRRVCGSAVRRVRHSDADYVMVIA